MKDRREGVGASQVSLDTLARPAAIFSNQSAQVFSWLDRGASAQIVMPQPASEYCPNFAPISPLQCSQTRRKSGHL